MTSADRFLQSAWCAAFCFAILVLFALGDMP
jgi:hypothetical protein